MRASTNLHESSPISIRENSRQFVDKTIDKIVTPSHPDPVNPVNPVRKTPSLPFEVKVPVCRLENAAKMTAAEYDVKLEPGYRSAIAGRVRPLASAHGDFRRRKVVTMFAVMYSRADS